MATVCDLNDFYPYSYGHCEYSSHTGDVCNIVNALNKKRKSLTKRIAKISQDQHMCSLLLDDSMVMVKNSASFMSQCRKAWELDDLDEMEAQRDMLTREQSARR